MPRTVALGASFKYLRDQAAKTVAQGGGAAALPFYPTDLGASLYDMWDAERFVETSGGLVTSWASVKNGYSAAQGSAAAQPALLDSAFNGRPSVVFDGVDDELTYPGVGVFPVGSSPSEVWVLLDQQSIPSDALVRFPFAYGGASTNNIRGFRRVVSASENAVLANSGDGVSAITSAVAGVLTGRHLLRGAFLAGSVTAYFDGTAGSTGSLTTNTGAVRTRFGAQTANTAANFFKGAIAAVCITAPLDVSQAAQMTAYFKARGGIT